MLGNRRVAVLRKQGGDMQAIVNAIFRDLGGADFTPKADLSNCWQDTSATIPAVEDALCVRLNCAAGSAHYLSQATAGYTPFLRKSLSVLPIVSSTGETWSISRTQVSDCAGIRWDESGVPYFKAVGVANNYLSTPNAVANQITGDISFVVKFLGSGSGVFLSLVDKYSPPNRQYHLHINISNKLVLRLSADGTTDAGYVCDTAITTGEVVWAKVTRTATTGDINFYTSIDGVTYSKQGATKSGISGALYNGSDSVSLIDGYAGSLGIGRIYYAAIYANDTATGVPAVEFNPAGVVRPTNYWLDADGVDDYYVTTVQPGLYDAGYVCGAFNQYEAIGNTNCLLGTTSSIAIPGYRVSINAAGKSEIARSDGSVESYSSSSTEIIPYVTFVASYAIEINTATSWVNNDYNTSIVSIDFRGTSQVGTMFNANNATSGIAGGGFYFTGSCSGMCWIPVIPTDEQQVAIRSYYASLGQVTL